ncbi:YggS family pyridoxal phosphate-dependent enzyme [Azonexus sp.]|uniref:YggS family pyridoxal phosphate-dependent enzyme n=1 Tax=Azonexus sp. TaxID=1872668 RepID=UPI0039E4D744
MSAIADKLQAVHRRIAAAAQAAGRAPEDVRLLAVSKSQSLSAIEAAIAAGQTDFAENYVQEALEKCAALKSNGILTWHFIGPLQSNKSRAIAEHFAWVHSIDRLRLAQRLSEQRPAALPPLQVCVQVNISGEASKSGCAPDLAQALCVAVAALPGLQLRGLMAIPAASADRQKQANAFRTLRLLAQTIHERTALPLDTLSMGMSDDLEAAIAEGATMVRIGSAIFGERKAR